MKRNPRYSPVNNLLHCSGGVRIGVVASLLIFGAFASLAQPYVSRLGRFQMDQIKGCAPLTVNITNANLITSGECVAGKPCLMTFEGSTQQQNSFSYTYSTPGTYKLSVLYQSQITGPDDITITVLPNLQPAFEMYSCSGNRVSVNITDKHYDQYFINFGDASPVVGIPFSNSQTATHTYAAAASYGISIHGKDLNSADNCNALVQSFQSLLNLPAPTINTLTSYADSVRLDFTSAPHLELRLEIATNNASIFQQFKTLYGVSHVTFTGMLLDQNFYCFRLSAYDPCSGANSYSNTICSQVFAATAQNNKNALTWSTPSAGVTNYSITRDGSPYVTTPVQHLDDTGVLCKTTYCYQLTTNYTNGSHSISLQKCADAFSTTLPTTITNATAVVGDTQVDLTWQQDPVFVPVSYTVLRAAHAGSPQFIASVTDPKYSDVAYTTEGNFCYRIDYIDQCGNNSLPGDLICPLRLSGVMDKKNVITLDWNAYTGWANGVKNYTLEKFGTNGVLLKTYTLGTVLTFVDNELDLLNQVVSYRLTAEPNDPFSSAVSNTARFVKGVNLFYPTAFTPNGDALNDGFLVSGHYIATIQVNIFDRWGTLIYTTDQSEPWDGTFNGKPMPESTYVWTAKLTDLAGRSQIHHGTVVLFNKKK